MVLVNFPTLVRRRRAKNPRTNTGRSTRSNICQVTPDNTFLTFWRSCHTRVQVGITIQRISHGTTVSYTHQVNCSGECNVPDGITVLVVRVQVCNTVGNTNHPTTVATANGTVVGSCFWRPVFFLHWVEINWYSTHVGSSAFPDKVNDVGWVTSNKVVTVKDGHIAHGIRTRNHSSRSTVCRPRSATIAHHIA